MAVRSTNKADDTNACLTALLKQLATATAPYSRWSIVEGYPNVEVAGEFTKAYLYIMLPLLSGSYQSQGSLKTHTFECIIGFWCDNVTGGENEMGVWESRMIHLFDNPQTVQLTQFTVTLGTTTYTNTTLSAMGIGIQSITGPGSDLGEDLKEFRREMTLTIIV